MCASWYLWVKLRGREFLGLDMMSSAPFVYLKDRVQQTASKIYGGNQFWRYDGVPIFVQSVKMLSNPKDSAD